MEKNIKLIIFDLDGVLVDAKEIHYEALNKSLSSINKNYIITREEHLSIYDGLPTKIKLEKLTSNKGLPKEFHEIVWQRKQEFTKDVIKEKLSENTRLINVLKSLKENGYKIYVASNSIRESLKLMLYKTGLIEYVDYYLSNDDVTHPKPHPEIYLKCMIHAGAKPSETLIVEDSLHGREAAISSGGILCPVDSPEDVTYEKLKKQLDEISDKKNENKKWISDDFNVLIPMAGAGSRFALAGYTFPKPLIEVRQKPMIQVVIENLNIKANYIYIVQKEHYEKYNLKFVLNLITPNCQIVQVDGLTQGAACTTLLAKDYINNDKHLLIANSDQYIEWNSNNFYYSIINNKSDGTVVTFESTHPKWSFVKLDHQDYISEIAEKKPISNIATVGLYYWNKGSEYVKYAEKMIKNEIRVNNEFYVAPVYNEAIKDGLKFRTYNIEKMWGLGTPEDLKIYLENKHD
jgi:HAD superfamily hydrolase (TIGR01509 family)